ncbi:MAG TPA: hypothetical protein PKH33_18260 [bacterium]|nr:hypothetical protein [bacterium]
MKNFNFSLALALYIFIVFSAFTSTRDFAAAAAAALAASPLIWLALFFIGRGAPRFDTSRTPTQAPISHFVALLCSALLFAMVWKMRTGTYFGSAMQMFGNYRVGWSLAMALQTLGLSVAICASALTIWTGYRFNDAPGGRAARAFFAGSPEIVRLLIFVYIVLAAWAIGVCAVAVAYKSASYSFEFLIMITGRAMIPAMGCILVALLRLKFMGIAVIAAAAAVFHLVSINIDGGSAAVFVAAAAGAAAVLFAARYFHRAGGSDGATPVVAAEPVSGSQSSPESGETIE